MVDLELGPLRFGVVGAGRLGIVLARSLQQAGFELVAASSATPVGCARASQALGIPVFSHDALVLHEIDVALICVPDDAIAATAHELAQLHEQSLAGLRVVHTSGCVSLNALSPLADLGADTLSLHPLQTITRTSTPADLRGAAAAVTASSTATRTFGHALAHAVGMTPFDLEDAARPLYHVASTFAANFTVTLLAAARDACRAAGVDEHVSRHAFASLARSAAHRVEQDGPEAALTGPIVRGDIGTLQHHLAVLDAHLPELAELYRGLATATTQLAAAGGHLTPTAVESFSAAIAPPAPASSGA